MDAKVVGESLMRYNVSAESQSIFPQISHELGMETWYHFTYQEKTDRYNLDQVIKANIINMGATKDSLCLLA